MSRQDERIAAFEARIGHRFADRSLLLKALTHTSATSNPSDSYQRLEFLGDRVLALAVARMIFDAYPAAEEGDLARRLNALVRRETCAEVARHLGLGDLVRLGTGEQQTGGRNRTAILGDVMEAVIAAVYLDAGIDTAVDFVMHNWRDIMVSPSSQLRDAKTTLQEWAQGRGLPTPIYREVGRSGPDHDPKFVVEVVIPGVQSMQGLGRSKREAAQAAASQVLVREGLWSGAPTE